MSLSRTSRRLTARSRGWTSPTILSALLAVGLIALAIPANAQTTCSRTYTTDADFDLGNLANVNHDTPDELQLNPQVTPPPFIWVACSQRGTAVRINVNTGEILGEYRTAPSGRLTDPSRTTVDLYGNVWVANRAEDGNVNSVGYRGSVIKIGLVIGGTRCDANGTANADGQYLKPPFIYSTAVDRDGDGLIRTSKGPADVLDWSNTDGVDDAGGVSTAEDECILIYKRTRGCHARHISVDANNDIWVGGYPHFEGGLEKIDGDDGTTLSTYSNNCGGYGGLIDGAGVLWSAEIYSNSLLRWDPASPGTYLCIGVNGSYGLGIDNNGYLWSTTYSTTVKKISPSGSIVGTYGTGGTYTRGVAVTSDGDVWVANSGSRSVSRLTNAGVLITTIAVGSTPTGLAVDANGKVWVTNYGSHSVMRIDPSTNSVDMAVSLGSGAGPYNYSDMTGAVALGATSLQGSWTFVQDAGIADASWGPISWTSTEPTGTGVRVEYRAANSAAGFSGPFTSVTSGVDFAATGRYLEVRATLMRDYGVSSTPVLSDLTVFTDDVTAPVVTPADDEEIECPNTPVFTDPTIADNCDETPTVTYADESTPACGNSYSVTRTWTVVDDANNTTTASQTIAVSDEMVPTISLNAPTMLWSPNHAYRTITISEMVSEISDACGPVPSIADVQIDYVTSDEPEDGSDDGSTVDDIVIAEDCNSVDLRAERSGVSNGRVYTVHLSVTDECLNTGTAEYKVTVPLANNGVAAFDDLVTLYMEIGCAGPVKPVRDGAPSITELEQNVPNPMTGLTDIGFTLGSTDEVVLSIVGNDGTVVSELIRGTLGAGRHVASWNGRDASGALAPSGTYTYRLEVKGYRTSRRLVVVR